MAKATVKQARPTVKLVLTEDEAQVLYALIDGLRLPAQESDVEAALNDIHGELAELDISWAGPQHRIKYLGLSG